MCVCALIATVSGSKPLPGDDILTISQEAWRDIYCKGLVIVSPAGEKQIMFTVKL